VKGLTSTENEGGSSENYKLRDLTKRPATMAKKWFGKPEREPRQDVHRNPLYQGKDSWTHKQLLSKTIRLRVVSDV